mgnify:FL=1|jgi:Zn finger protein HypA/HybF involved in hydrogenase expression|tara:strand:+ start:555 stop:728 length:174 start_codon:yes stop_codon:yes gene_type:complete
MTKKQKIKCSKCNLDAVIIEKEVYYCGSCAVEQFITRVHKRLRFKPSINNSKNVSST